MSKQTKIQLVERRFFEEKKYKTVFVASFPRWYIRLKVDNPSGYQYQFLNFEFSGKTRYLRYPMSAREKSRAKFHHMENEWMNQGSTINKIIQIIKDGLNNTGYCTSPLICQANYRELEGIGFSLYVKHMPINFDKFIMVEENGDYAIYAGFDVIEETVKEHIVYSSK